MNNENGLTPSQLAERNATLVTEIEKCRELSGCPAGVDLRDWVKQLVSELSVVEEIHNNAVFITDELYDASPKEVQAIIRSLACMKMPTYARLVAGIKADGVEMFALMFAEEAIKDNNITTGWKARASRAASEYAELLREGSK
ncbi:TPA: hypothetical protein ACXP4G_002972 [Klebsiella pneumoniae]